MIASDPGAPDVLDPADLALALDLERTLLARITHAAALITSELDRDRVMQKLTDEATAIVGAQFGAFFYNVVERSGESYMLYTLSGAPREAFEKFGMPRNTAVFAPTFAGDGVVRSDDITRDPRYGHNAPHRGMPKGHLPVVSYLAVPVRSVQGDVIGGLFFGHPEPARFVERDERAVTALAAIAAAALDNARLFTERKYAEDALRASEARLEKRVEERTAALLDANKELESFSYSVSHDLRAPIRHVSGYVDLLRARNGDKLDEKSVHYLDTIANATRTMGRLIDGLLSFSRLGRAEIERRRVALDEIVAAVVREQEADIAGRKVVWAIEPLPIVLGDPTMLRLVFSNLVGNAVKYSGKREEARIEIGVAERDGQHLFWVKDNGSGFNMAYAHKLFGVFSRLHSDTEFPGTGIGLATVRRVLQRHGGTIWAKSAPDEGATFFFTLPHAEVTA